MDIQRVIVELRTELEILDGVILSFERLAAAHHRAGRQTPNVRPAGQAKEPGKALPARNPAAPLKRMSPGAASS